MDEPQAEPNHESNQSPDQGTNPSPKPDVQPTAPPPGKAFDIFSPGQTTPPASSRPIIVSHKAMAKDTTVTGNQEVLKQDYKEAGAPPVPDEHQQLLDTHKKVNLQPVSAEVGEENHENEPAEHHEESKPAEPEPVATNLPEYDRPLESTHTENHEENHDQPPDEHTEPAPESVHHETEPKHDEPSPAFSHPEHNEAGPQMETHSEQPPKDEKLLAEHAGQDIKHTYNHDEQFNQFVISHHKTARQKWLRKFGIILVIVVIAGVAIGIAIWKMNS